MDRDSFVQVTKCPLSWVQSLLSMKGVLANLLPHQTLLSWLLPEEVLVLLAFLTWDEMPSHTSGTEVS